MICNKCKFYCYEDEYICPNCGTLQTREFPMDKDEKTLFIHEKITNFNKTKKRISILKSGRQLLILVFIMQIIWSVWIHDFVVVRIPKPNYDIASYSLVFALALYGIILGKPELISDKEYAKIRQPKTLIKNLKRGKMILLLPTCFVRKLTAPSAA